MTSVVGGEVKEVMLTWWCVSGGDVHVVWW